MQRRDRTVPGSLLVVGGLSVAACLLGAGLAIGLTAPATPPSAGAHSLIGVSKAISYAVVVGPRRDVQYTTCGAGAHLVRMRLPAATIAALRTLPAKERQLFLRATVRCTPDRRASAARRDATP